MFSPRYAVCQAAEAYSSPSEPMKHFSGSTTGGFLLQSQSRYLILFYACILLVLHFFSADAFVPSNKHFFSADSFVPTYNRQRHHIRPILTPEHSLSASPVNQDKASESAASNQNLFGIASDAVTGIIFSCLHAFDDCDIKDSSKNLRVLWVRALLNYRNKIDDEVAQELLPKATRGLVTTEAGASFLDPILKFAEWVQARTEFIDAALENFLSSPACHDAENNEDLVCNVVLFGSGYDTRALRFRDRHSKNINFIEVDLPEVVEGKTKLYNRFQERTDPSWDFGDKHTLVPFDLNECGGNVPKSLIKTLREQGSK